MDDSTKSLGTFYTLYIYNTRERKCGWCKKSFKNIWSFHNFGIPLHSQMSRRPSCEAGLVIYRLVSKRSLIYFHRQIEKM